MHPVLSRLAEGHIVNAAFRRTVAAFPNDPRGRVAIAAFNPHHVEILARNPLPAADGRFAADPHHFGVTRQSVPLGTLRRIRIVDNRGGRAASASPNRGPDA